MPVLDESIDFLTGARNGTVDADTYRVLNVPRVALLRLAAFSCADSTFLSIPWDTTEYDTDKMWDPNVPRVITAKTSGVYNVTACVVFDPSATGIRQIFLRKNGVGSYNPSTNGPYSYTSTSANIMMNKGDVVDAVIVQTSGSPLSTTAFTLPDHLTALQAVLVSTI